MKKIQQTVGHVGLQLKYDSEVLSSKSYLISNVFLDTASCKDCCERVAWSSIVASVLTVIGVVLVVVCVGFNSRIAGPLFSNTYIEDAVYTW